MGTVERREREKEQRRQLILNAAEHVFFSKGIDAANMDDIAEQAELGKGTLYLYFANKDDLISGICYRALLELKSRFETAIAEHNTGREQLIAIGRAYFSFAEEQSDYYHIMMRVATGRETIKREEPYVKACSETGLAIHRITAQAIRKGCRDGTLKSEYDPIELAHLLWGQTTGVIQVIHQNRQHLEQECDLDCDRLTQLYFQLVERSLQ